MNKDNSEFLDKKYIHEFMELINNNEMFLHKPELLNLYNLTCTFKDRITTVVDYLNGHNARPETEEAFISYMVYASMLYDGFNKMHENLMHIIPKYKGKKFYFKYVKHYDNYYFTEDTCPTDDVFFEYLRAMTFAHPYQVDYKGRPFIKQNEKHYCPFVVINNIMSFDDIKESVGIRIYTSIDQDSIIDLTFSFNSLKRYIKSIYNTFPVFIKWATDLINGQNEEWKQTKINRKQEDIAIFNEIKEVLESRFANTNSINDAISYITCKTTNQLNDNYINIFRKKLIQEIPKICDCVDNLDYEGMEEALSIIYARPTNMHQMAHYQLEKIYTYLDKRSEIIDRTSNEYWGLQQAYNFYQEFAKKWVSIDVSYMQYDEIKLLVATACFLEKQEQDMEGGNTNA